MSIPHEKILLKKTFGFDVVVDLSAPHADLYPEKRTSMHGWLKARNGCTRQMSFIARGEGSYCSICVRFSDGFGNRLHPSAPYPQPGHEIERSKGASVGLEPGTLRKFVY